MKRRGWIVALLLSMGPSLRAQTTPSGSNPWSGILAPSRAIDWSQAGVLGGIPIRTNICATFSPGATAAQISSALQSCNNGVVNLNPGTYNIAGINFGGGKSNVTLRGAGADQTFIVFTGPASGCTLPADVCMEDGNNNWGGGPNNVANWTAGYAKGTTVITLSNVNNLIVGNPLILDQLDSTQDDGSILVTQTTSTLPFTAPGLAGPYSVQGNAGAQRNGRQQEQIVTVTAINGNQVTISPGLYMPNWNAASAPQAWWATNPAAGLGLENLSMDHTANNAFNSAFGVAIKNCTGCWVSGVRDYDSARAHIQLKYANHVTVRDSYLVLTAWHSTSSYGWECYSGSDNLVENNIIQGVASPLMFGGPCSGSVIGYNFAINDYYTDANNTTSSPTPGYNQNTHGDHTAGEDSALIEGNYGNIVNADAIHGTHNLMTYFRNRFTGAQPACWQSGMVVPTTSTYPAGLTWGSCTNNLEPFKLSAFSRFYNLIGNVLGTSGTNTGYINSGTSILSLGPGNGSVPSDPNVQSTVMLWGNYDTYNAAARFLASEVPSALTGTQAPYANTVPATTSLPPSFYYASQPPWWPSGKPWPPIGPDVAGGNLTNVGGHAYTIPAQDCYLNVMGGLPNGTGPVLNFNAATCYGTGTPPPPAPVNNIVPLTLAISAPANGATLSGMTSISGTAQDGVLVSSVAVSVDGGTFALATGTAAWSYSLNTTSLSNGSHTLTAKGWDVSGGVATSSIGVIVSNVTPAPAITSAGSASGTIGSPFWYQITASNNPASFNATGLPAGLSVNTSNGLISGTPSVTGTSNVTISAANAGGTGSAMLMLTISSASSSGKTITAADCGQPSVQAAINSANPGDTVLIPAGTCTWASTLSINPSGSLSVIGTGPGQTVIQSNVNGSLATISLSSSAFVRFGGMTLQPLAGETVSANSHVLTVVGTCTASGCSPVRLDHLTFTGWVYNGWAQPGNNFPNFVMTALDVYGVLDHLNVLATGFGEFVNTGFDSYLGVGQYGDNSWASPDAFGTNAALYIEDSTFTETGNTNFALIDTDNAPYGGGRFVIRHNALTNFGLTNHGTETTGRTRGGRVAEIYGNSFTCTNTNGCNTAMEFRSGTGLFYNNTLGTTSNSWYNTAIQVHAYRTFANLGGWGWCDGTGPWDQNDGIVYDAGTYTGPSGGTTTIIDASKNWTANQWTAPGAPYSIHNVTQGFGYEISGNTSNTITVSNYNQDYWNGPPKWNNGDTYQILRARSCIDQGGRGQSILLSGNTPMPTGWVQNALAPVYEWGDVFTGGHFYYGWAGSDTGRIIANRDYYSQVLPFTGASGTGTGALASRPATCTQGVAYWATDANALYQCSAPNTWTTFYTPYAYPHPLTQGGSVASGAPAITSALTLAITAPAAGATVSGTVLVAGTAQDGMLVSSVAVSIDGGAYALAAGTSSWTFVLNTASLTNGGHTIAAQAWDALGASATAQVQITVSNLPPISVSISSPAARASVSGLVTVVAAASGGSGIASVQFQIDGQNLGGAVTSAPYTTLWNSLLTPRGQHVLTAIAVDSQGHQATSPGVAVFVRHTRMTLGLSASSPGMVVLALDSDDPTLPSAPMLTVQVNLPSGVKTLSLVNISASTPTYSMSLSSALFSPADFALAGSSVTLTIGAQTFTLEVLGNAVNPAMGGLVADPGGSGAQVLVAGGGVTDDARISFTPLPVDTGARAAALKKQGFLQLGAGQDVVFNSTGVLVSAMLTLPFDPALIPQGLTTTNVRIGYFNASTGLWEMQDSPSVSGGMITTKVTHFSPYAPLLLLPSSAPNLVNSYTYPNPAAAPADPTIRAMMGVVNDVEVSIFDVSGRLVHSATVSGAPTGIFNGNYYYDYTWGGPKASGVYFAVIHGHAADGTLVRARTKFVVVR